VSKRSDYLAELEGHWEAFKDAGFVERVRYYAYDPTTGHSATGSAKVDAIRDGEGVRKVEEQRPDGGKVIVRRLAWHLRRSQLDGPVTKRGKVVDADGVSWLIDGEVHDAGDETDWQFDTVRM